MDEVVNDSTIGVLKPDMAATLPGYLKADFHQCSNKLGGFDRREGRHQTMTFWTPTNNGKSPNSGCSSRHISMTSRMLLRSSSMVRPWV